MSKCGNCSKYEKYFFSLYLGCVKCLQEMTALMNRPVYGLQCTVNTPHTSVSDMATHYLKVCYIYCMDEEIF